MSWAFTKSQQSHSAYLSGHGREEGPVTAMGSVGTGATGKVQALGSHRVRGGPLLCFILRWLSVHTGVRDNRGRPQGPFAQFLPSFAFALVKLLNVVDP